MLTGCANLDTALAGDPRETRVFALGARSPGAYAHYDGMSLADLFDEAGGYEECKHCEEYAEKHGSHPTYRAPATVMRSRKSMRVPKMEWGAFLLEPGDVLKVPHVLW